MNHKVRANTIRLTSPLFTEMPVPSLEREWSCICVLLISSLPLFTIFHWILELIQQYDIFSFFINFSFMIINKQHKHSRDITVWHSFIDTEWICLIMASIGWVSQLKYAIPLWTGSKCEMFNLFTSCISMFLIVSINMFFCELSYTLYWILYHKSYPRDVYAILWQPKWNIPLRSG